MKDNIGEKPRKKNKLLLKCVFIVLLAIILVIVGIWAYSIYHANYIRPVRCVEVNLPIYCSYYGYYSASNFLGESNFFGEHDIGSQRPFIQINLMYFTVNKTWVLLDNIEDVIHFKITDPVTGKYVVGDYTPNISIVNNTFYSDVLIINWNDTAQKGSCYIIKGETVYWDSSGHPSSRNHGQADSGKYDKRLGINQYDEFGTSVMLYVPSNYTTGQLGYSDNAYQTQEDRIIERNCTAPYSQRMLTWIAFREIYV